MYRPVALNDNPAGSVCHKQQNLRVSKELAASPRVACQLPTASSCHHGGDHVPTMFTEIKRPVWLRLHSKGSFFHGLAPLLQGSQCSENARANFGTRSQRLCREPECCAMGLIDVELPHERGLDKRHKRGVAQ